MPCSRLFKVALFALCAISAGPVLAQDRVGLGFVRLFNNDLLGDGRDRWRSGSYQFGYLRGPEWSGARPLNFGDLLEFRLRGEVIAPANLVRPRPDDRPYAGSLSLGVHSYWQRRGYDLDLGLDVVATGSQSNILNWQRQIHRWLGQPLPNVAGRQVDGAIVPTVNFEIGRDIGIALGGGAARLRPFFQAQVGIETLARVGADVTLGDFGQGGLRVRDVVTGQRMPAIDAAGAWGTSFLLGGDVAHVADSFYLPSGMGVDLMSTRGRLRMGVRHSTASWSVFYGVSYLTREFESQPSGQAVGSLTLNLSF
ncbi:lipid A-modifier LpxR family protein [Brevirhabdus sp.]|uniref:lipid A-modifier LpxR family protein n=1 Tax=Brevirhabdus sp. TaxID=2004514 RepID=UPI00405875FC